MRENDRTEFYALVSSTYAFYRVDCSPFALGVWWEACKQFGVAAVTKALTGHAADPETGQYCPKPADVVKRLVPAKTEQTAICDHCARPLTGWTKFRSGRICNPCYQAYLNGDWDPAKERAA